MVTDCFTVTINYHTKEVLPMRDTCIICNIDIPEGLQVCKSCVSKQFNIITSVGCNLCVTCKHHSSILRYVYCKACNHNHKLHDMYKRKGRAVT